MFLPENIDLSKPENYVLSIRLKPDGFSFFIYDVEDHNSYCYQQAVFSNEVSLFNNIQRIIFDYNFLTENFRQVNVVFVSLDYELIPTSFYDKKTVSKLYTFTNTKESFHLLTESIENEEYKLVFDVNEDIYLFLKRSLFSPSFCHYSSKLSTYLQNKTHSLQGNKLLVFFQDDFVNILSFDQNNRLIFNRSYYKEHYQDIIYYTLSFWEKLNFNQLSDHLLLAGTLTDNKIEDVLKDYVKNIRKIDLSDMTSGFGEDLQEIPLDLLILTT